MGFGTTRFAGNAFDVNLSNVPIINLRNEFREFYRAAHSPHFLKQPDGRVRAVQTRYVVWLGMPMAAASIMICRSIIGLEAYVCFAVQTVGASSGRTNPALVAACASPFSLGGGAAKSHYDRLPAMLDQGLALSVSNPALWNRTLSFYREIRNPLFHGHEFNDISNERFASLYELLAELYEWIDSWFDIQSIFSGGPLRVDVPRPR